jgi:hypothetical protein
VRTGVDTFEVGRGADHRVQRSLVCLGPSCQCGNGIGSPAGTFGSGDGSVGADHLDLLGQFHTFGYVGAVAAGGVPMVRGH